MSDDSATHPEDQTRDLARVTIEDFEPHVGSSCLMHLPDADPVELRLIQAIDEHLEANGPPEGRRPFSIILEAANDAVVPQGIHELRHAALGKLDAFIVPFGIFEGKTRYNIIFN